MDIRLSKTRYIKQEDIIEVYRANGWSASEKPDELYNALMNSHTLVTAWDGDRLVGLENAITDGYLSVYYPHLLVHPEYQGKGLAERSLPKCKRGMPGSTCKCW